MNFAEQLRLLQAAQGDPAKLALTTVDLAHPTISDFERTHIKMSLEVAAIAHWFDEVILATLLEISPEESAVRMAQLRALNVVEPFPARGHGAANVHEASRLVLRNYLALEKKRWFDTLTRRAFDYFKEAPEAHNKIEAAFHQALIEPVAGADEIDAIYLDWFLEGLVAEKLALAVMLEELRTFAATPALPTAVAAHRIADIRTERQPVEKTAALAREAPATYRAQCDGLRMCRVLSTLGTSLTELGDSDGAREAFLEAVVIGRKRVAESPEVIERLRNLCISLDNLGDFESANGHKDEAMRILAESLAVRRKIAAREPSNLNWQRLLGLSLFRLGNLNYEQGQIEVARANFTEYLEISRRLVAVDSNNTMWQQDLEISLNRLGDLEQGQGQFEVARANFSESLEISRRLVAMDSVNTLWQHNLAVSLNRLGNLDTAQGRLDEARRAYAEQLDILKHLAALDPKNITQQRSLAVTHYRLAWFNRENSDESGFESELLACYNVLDQMKRHNQLADPHLAHIHQQLAQTFNAGLSS